MQDETFPYSLTCRTAPDTKIMPCLHPSAVKYRICFGIAVLLALPSRGRLVYTLYQHTSCKHCRKKSRPFLSEAGGTICRAKQRSFLSVSLILRRLNGTASNAGFLARFVARFLCLPGLPSGLLSKSRSPYSCGTAQALHLFFPNRGALPIPSYAQKAGRRAPSLALTDFFHIISE